MECQSGMQCDAKNCENKDSRYVYPRVKYCPGDVSAPARYM